MFDKFFDRLFNGSNEKEIKKIRKIVEQKINPLEDGLKKLSDSSLANKTNEFKERLAKGETLDDILRLFVKPPAACWECVTSIPS